MTGDVLILCHGEGAGRPKAALPPFLDHLARTAPATHKRLRLQTTDQPPPDLDGVAAVLCFLADPLREMYPACYAVAKTIETAARERGLPVWNPPDALSNTRKAVQADIWTQAGFRCARSQLLPTLEFLTSKLADLPYPCILRDHESHAQERAFLCHAHRDAERILPRLRFPAVALEFIETRAQGGDVFLQRHYLKKRAMVFGPRVANNHIFYSDNPIVGLGSSTFFASTKWPLSWLHRLGFARSDLDHALALDNAYWNAPAEAPDVMRAAVQALGLQVAAVDYSNLPDGSVVLWEANPYFTLKHWSEGLLPIERRLEARIGHFHDVFGQALLELAEGEASC
jgi:hypothetical protein